ncbi:MAG: TetR family transcriptional regulator [Actinophytocola sp.]|nr:TetR family transcriptional regulator [Actinophytocola sp.]
MPAPPRKRRPYAARMPVAERKQQILDAALQVVVERGHGKVTMDTVAEEAGVTKPVVYSVFDSRAHLLAALLKRERDAAVAQVVDALDAAHVDIARTPPDQLLADVSRVYLNGVAAAPYRWRCILFAVDGAPEELRAAIDEARELLRGLLGSLLTSLVARQPEPPAVDIDILSHSLVAFAEMAGRLLLDHPDRYDVDRLVRSATTLVRLVEP